MKTITVTQINSYIKNMFKQDFLLSRVSVKGEISNCKYHSSGHVYFTLKDEGGALSAIMFAGNAKSLKFKLTDGIQVVVDGRIDVYERDGKYQLYATDIVQEGIGDLYRRFEELKQHFEEMGYFQADYKRPIPYFSKKIGIVTSPTGAAVRDIMNISYRRNPYVELTLFPALVQGDGAAASIVTGIQTLDAMGLDVIIVGRGGGSIEDLWAFNEEIVAEAVFNAQTPIISAVGHETDFTITDFVADLRAPTPSAAAELAVQDIRLVEERIASYRQLLFRALSDNLEDKRRRTETYAMRLKYLSPVSLLNDRRIQLDKKRERLDSLFGDMLKAYRHTLEIYSSRLHGVSPLERLSQGYSYAANEKGENVSSVRDTYAGDTVTITVRDGLIVSEVKEVIQNEADDA